MPRRKKLDPPAQTPKSKDPNMVTYLLTMRDETQKKITIPADWKVTFGPLTPGSKDHTINSSGALSLRIYENSDRQRAVFTGVESFRDTSIEIEERITRRQREVFQKDTPNGAKNFVAEAQIHEWVNPDEPRESNQDEFKLLTSDKQ